LDELNVFDANLARRQAAGQLYMNAFRKHDNFTIPAGIVPDGVYTRFPVICRTAEQASALFALLAQRKLHPGKWYRPTLFPGPTDPALYHYNPASYPVAEDISARIVNLPTNISTERVKEIIHACHR
ncbi:MAG TPA: DegT/DnrJ/EryC1/StrS family aminotransferase, partial [Candidatus Saccharibacteria bacterium]|nr:DegT/DnrJ/EryC1/StrS family aminotransferase [Candidatus Saccharibacteria bacterium]